MNKVDKFKKKTETERLFDATVALFNGLTDDERWRILDGEAVEIYRSDLGQCAVVIIEDGKLCFGHLKLGEW